MDEIKLMSSFSRHVLSKVINSQIKKKFGDGVTLHISDFSIESADNGGYLIDLCADADVSGEAFRKLCNKWIGSGTS